MNHITPNGNTQTLVERAKQYLSEIKDELEQYRADDIDTIVGLDPESRTYWVGRTESSILEQRAAAKNTNLVYFIKLTPRQPRSEKLVMSI